VSLCFNVVVMSLKFALAPFALAVALVAAPLETPEQFAGFRMGSDRNLVRWDGIVEYMRKAAAASPRVRVDEAGKTTEGNPFIVVTITSPENMRDLDKHRALQQRLVYARGMDNAEAARLLDTQKAVVLVTCNIHSTEIASSQMALELVHRLASEDSRFVRNILDNVILLLVPSANPDGQIIVTDWYRKNDGTEWDASFMPELYHKYTGHDNNRDAFMNTQVESRLLNRLAYKEWFPHVFFDQHQMGSNGARAWVPPFRNPINPNVDPMVWELNGLFGYAMGAGLTGKGYSGVITDTMFTSWWQGGFLMQAWWHNMVGLLTELASARIATPIEQELARPGQAPGPELTREQAMSRDPRKPLPPPRDVTPRNNYPRPWLGGRWTLRDIVDYELTATWAALELAANQRDMLVRAVYDMNRRGVERGEKEAPYAWVIPARQHDPAVAARLAQILDELGVEVHRAAAAFTAGAKQYPAGSYVVLMAQPYRACAKDLLEKQDYPVQRAAPGAEPERPYDVTGWTLPYQMGVEAVEVARKFEAKLERVGAIAIPAGRFEAGANAAGYEIGRNANNTSIAINRLLKNGHELSWTPGGDVFVRQKGAVRAELERWSRELGIDVKAAAAPAKFTYLRQPRLGLYRTWAPNMDEGWTRWLLEQYEFPYTSIRPSDVKGGKLRERFDAILIADFSKAALIKGVENEWIRPEHRGGMGQEGVAALKEFVRAGGTLLAIGGSTLLPIEEFPLPLRNALRDAPPGQFSCPGSILRIFVDNTAAAGYGMPEEASAVFYNNLAFEPTAPLGDAEVRAIAKYPASGLLKSGWMQGEQFLADRIAAAEVRMGKGRVIVYGFAVQKRAQPHGTFKLLFNGIHSAGVE
jgi:hypothetical protein